MVSDSEILYAYIYNVLSFGTQLSHRIRYATLKFQCPGPQLTFSYYVKEREVVTRIYIYACNEKNGGLAQSEERNVSNVEAPGSKPGFSTYETIQCINV